MVALATAGSAAAKLPSPTTLGSAATGAPIVFVDPRGTVNALRTVTDRNGYATVRYARKPAGASRFTTVAIPGMPSTSGAPFIYAPSPGTLEVIVTVNGPLDLAAWISNNDGSSWTRLPTTPLMKWSGEGYYLQAQSLHQSAGGPFAYAGSDGAAGPFVELNSSISQATVIGTDTSQLISTRLARSRAGTIFILGPPADSYTNPGALPFQAGAATGQVTFPCLAANARAGTAVAMTAGTASAVVAFAGCDKVWTRTISPSGAVGPLVTVGRSPGAAGYTRTGDAWVDVVAAPNGAFTSAFTVPGNDVQVAHSSNGTHWSLSRGLLPVVLGTLSGGRALSLGTPSWLGFTGEVGNSVYRADVIPVSATYRQPSAPRGAGVKAVLGSTAATVPGRISHVSFGRSGNTTLKLIDVFGGKVAISISVTRVTKQTTHDLCSGSLNTRLSAGKTKTVTVACGSGVIVIGRGGAARGVAVKKGDSVAITITGRNGPLVVNSKIS
jgi:hypothetical protein